MSYTHTLGALTDIKAAPPPKDTSEAAVAARLAYLKSPDFIAGDICLKLSQAGALVMADGRRAVIGSPEMRACHAKAKAALESGSTREQAAAAAQQAAITGSSNNLLMYGLIGAVVLVGGAWYLSK